MAEYIEKQAVLDEIDEEIQEFPECEYALSFSKRWIKKLPLADVRPVVRGRWIPFTSEAAGDIWYCSACDIGFAHHMDFCPHCGADMRGGDAE